ncbi:MAG: (2Fe-2S)-binding protein [Clostridiales Family XIII bacterium]|jgi:carbon-monoxide dehydrogenase small subunit|nr:(2Fe-2S)-binding protein [Clostridiales Family XIII bacterium]
MQKIVVAFTLNGKPVRIETAPGKRVLDLLREDFGCLSVKDGCGEGECGACTILLNGEPVTSCQMLAGQIDGDDVVTLEGVCEDGRPSRLQECFLAAGAVQCGYCIPGMVLTAKALLAKSPHPAPEEIRRALSGNLCRCTGYAKIFKAVRMAAGEEGGGAP